MGLTVQTYPETVEQIIEETTSIGVAGAHGKTSTSGLLAHVLSGVSPTSYLVGDGSGKGTLMHVSSFLKQMNIVVISLHIIQIMRL